MKAALQTDGIFVPSKTTAFSWNHLIGLLFLIAGFFLVILPYVGIDFGSIPGDFGDARFNLYVLEHGFQYITGQVDSYWSAPFFYPAREVTSYSDNLLGNLPIYALFRFLNFNSERSFQFWFIVCMVLNYISAYWALCKFKLGSYPAAVGAFIFAFSLALKYQLCHAQMFPRYFIPPLFYYLWHYAHTFSRKSFVLASIWWILGLFSGLYLAFLALVPAITFFLDHSGCTRAVFFIYRQY